MFITNEAARQDPACQLAMASYLKRLQAEEAAPSWGTTDRWDISDRH